MTSSMIPQFKDILIENGKFLVKKFETADKDIVNYFQGIEPQARIERLENVLKVGVVALKTIGTTDKVDYVEKEFENLNHKFSEEIDKHFGKDGKIMKELFDPNKEGTPLYNLRNEIVQLRQQISVREARDDIIKKTPLKGKLFETVCEDILSQVAHHFGDGLENTTGKHGKLTGSKKGDFVISHAENSKRIVFEVKDTATISNYQIQRTLSESLENRGASYGILVVKSVESLPKSVGWFQECGNKMLACALSTQESEDALHVELLLIAYKWARLRIMMQSFKENKVDAGFIEDKITKIQHKISELRTIRTQCTNIETSSDKIRTVARYLEETIGRELSEILGSIASK